MPRQTDYAIRFWNLVQRGEPDECWEWRSTRHKHGYGVFRVGQGVRRASRVAWSLANGPIPDGLGICHRCDNPPCCNPAHLFAGTQADNVRDMTRKGRRVDHKGEAHGRAKLSDDAVREIRRLAALGVKQRDLARSFSVGQSTISGIRSGLTWKHI